MGAWSQKGFLVAVALASFHLLCQPLGVREGDLVVTLVLRTWPTLSATAPFSQESGGWALRAPGQ